MNERGSVAIIVFLVAFGMLLGGGFVYVVMRPAQLSQSQVEMGTIADLRTAIAFKDLTSEKIPEAPPKKKIASVPAEESVPKPPAPIPAPVPTPVPAPAPAPAPDPKLKVFNLSARNYSFSRSQIAVQTGDTIRIELEVTGGTHNFVLPEYGIKSPNLGVGERTTIEFVADRYGVFEYTSNYELDYDEGMSGLLIVK